MVASLPEGGSWRMLWHELKRRVPSPSTNMPVGIPSPGMVTVVTVASRAAGRARLGAEDAAIFARIWDGGAFETAEELAKARVYQETSFLKPKPTNRRAARSTRALLQARRRREAGCLFFSLFSFSFSRTEIEPKLQNYPEF